MITIYGFSQRRLADSADSGLTMNNLKEALVIPHEVEPLLLPNPQLSILELLKYWLPLIATTTSKTQEFFNNNTPMKKSAQAIVLIPSPSQATVIALQNQLLEATTKGIRSIWCPHVPHLKNETYPLWIVTYWASVDVIRPIRDAWQAAEHYLAEQKQDWKVKKNAEGVEVVNRIFAALSTLRWSDKLRGFMSNAGRDLDKLSYYASNKWLTDEHANQMLDLLRRDLDRRVLLEIFVGSSWFFAKLRQAFEAKEMYRTAKTYRQYQNLALDIQAGLTDKVSFLVNLDQNHWVAVVVDIQLHKILYGDPLGMTIPRLVKETLDWWLNYHSFDTMGFTYDQLPITLQKDSFSCGLLSWNALVAHLIDGAELLAADAVSEGRLQVLLDIIYELDTTVRKFDHDQWTY